jgi:hypothetical protein
MFWPGLSRIRITLRVSSRVKAGLVVLGWGVFLASSALTAILQGLLLPARFYGGTNAEVPVGVGLFFAAIFGVSILAGAVLADAATALLGAFGSYIIGVGLTFMALSIPTVQSRLPATLVSDVAVVFTFTVFFPFPIPVVLIGSLLGVGLSDRL